jgi:hypothetical protein
MFGNARTPGLTKCSVRVAQLRTRATPPNRCSAATADGGVEQSRAGRALPEWGWYRSPFPFPSMMGARRRTIEDRASLRTSSSLPPPARAPIPVQKSHCDRGQRSASAERASLTWPMLSARRARSAQPYVGLTETVSVSGSLH